MTFAHDYEKLYRELEAKLKEQSDEPVGTVVFRKHRKAPDVDWAVNIPINNGAKLYTHQPRDEQVETLKAKLKVAESALDNCRLYAARYRKEEWASHITRFCYEAGVHGSILREE